MSLLGSLGLFLLTGLCEIWGGYTVWLWLRGGRPIGYAVAGAGSRFQSLAEKCPIRSGAFPSCAGGEKRSSEKGEHT